LNNRKKKEKCSAAPGKKKKAKWYPSWGKPSMTVRKTSSTDKQEVRRAGPFGSRGAKTTASLVKKNGAPEKEQKVNAIEDAIAEAGEWEREEHVLSETYFAPGCFKREGVSW